MTTIRNTVVRADGTPVAGVRVLVYPVVPTDSPLRPHYPATDPATEEEILLGGETLTDAAGDWTMDVEPSTALEPAGAVAYRVVQYPPGGSGVGAFDRIVVVPDSASVLWVPDLEELDPDSVTELSALDQHAAQTTNVHGIDDAGALVQHDGTLLVGGIGQVKSLDPPVLEHLDPAAIATLTIEGPWGVGTAYAERVVVTHDGKVWISSAATAAGEEPGVAAVWVELPAAIDSELRASTPRAVNVREYGAVGDGVTDDTVAVRAALTDVLADPHGGTLYFPPGDYFVTRQGVDTEEAAILLTEVDDVTILGAPGATLRGHADLLDGHYRLIKAEGCHRVTVEGLNIILTLEGEPSLPGDDRYTGAAVMAIQTATRTSEDFTLRRCKISSSHPLGPDNSPDRDWAVIGVYIGGEPSTGFAQINARVIDNYFDEIWGRTLWLWKTTGTLVQGNRFYRSRKYTIRGHIGNNGVRIIGNHFIGHDTGYAGACVFTATEVDPASKISVVGNTFEVNGEAVSFQGVRDSVIADNVITAFPGGAATTQPGIHVSEMEGFGYHAERIVISGNEITKCQDGIYIGAVNGLVISGNQIDQCTARGIGYFANVEGSGDWLIADNIIRRSGGSGITGTGGPTSLTGVTIRGNEIADGGSRGINAVDVSDGIKILHNVIRDNADRGIYSASSTSPGTLIADNIILDNGGDRAIMLNEPTCRILRNTIRHVGTGLYLFGSAPHTVIDNDLRECSTAASIIGDGAIHHLRGNMGGLWSHRSGIRNMGGTLTSRDVFHGLGYAPDLADIKVVPTGSLGSASYFWVTNPTATTFTINVNTAPGVAIDWSWSIIRWTNL